MIGELFPLLIEALDFLVNLAAPLTFLIASLTRSGLTLYLTAVIAMEVTGPALGATPEQAHSVPSVSWRTSSVILATI